MSNKKMFEVEYEYDIDADAIFINKQIDYKYKHSVELNNNVIIDFDENNKPVAIEILNASTELEADKFSLKRMKGLGITIVITKDNICVDVKIIVEVRNRKTELILHPSISNDMGIPEVVAELGIA